jgi:hypothetical protein
MTLKNSFQNAKPAAWLSFGEEQGGGACGREAAHPAEGAILREACPTATTLLPAQQIFHPEDLKKKNFSFAFRSVLA